MLSPIYAVVVTPLCAVVCAHPPACLQRSPVRISCPLDTTSSVSMPPIDGHIDPLFDCLDNLCEFQLNASHSGFKDVCGSASPSHTAGCWNSPLSYPSAPFPPLDLCRTCVKRSVSSAYYVVLTVRMRTQASDCHGVLISQCGLDLIFRSNLTTFGDTSSPILSAATTSGLSCRHAKLKA